MYWVQDNIDIEEMGRRMLADGISAGILDPERVNAAIRWAEKNGWHCTDWQQIAGATWQDIPASPESVEAVQAAGIRGRLCE